MEKELQENVEVKAVEETPADTVPKNKEAAVLEQAIEQGEVSPEYGLQEDGVYKINVDSPPEKTEKTKENAIQERETKETVLQDERSEVGLSEVGSEVRETPESNEEAESLIELVEDNPAEKTVDSPIEIIENEENNSEESRVVKSDEPAPTASEQKEILQETKAQELPEGVNKLVQFIEDTGGTVEDYARLNRDLDKIDNLSLVREYYEYTKPHLDKEDIDFLINKNFAYDTDLDDPNDIKAKQLAFKEELFNAQKTFKDVKEKYYADLKLRKKQEVPNEYKNAMAYYNKTQQLIEEETKNAEKFAQETKNVFTNNFKGFDFKVGENNYRFKVDNPQKTKEFQSNINNFLNQFQNKEGFTDAEKYHKALFTAQNADKIANHFYEQGRADAIKESAKKAKNINMDPRTDNSSIITKSGDTIRVVSGDSSDKLRIKWK